MEHDTWHYQLQVALRSGWMRTHHGGRCDECQDDNEAWDWDDEDVYVGDNVDYVNSQTASQLCSRHFMENIATIAIIEEVNIP